MALKTEQLLTLKQLPSIGDAKVFAMANYAIDMSIDGIKDLLDFTNSCIIKKIIKGVKKEYLKGFDFDAIKAASNVATSIIGRSEDAGINIVSYYDDLFPEPLKTIKTETNIESVACFWGTKERKVLINSEYRHEIVKPNEIITLIR